MIDLERSMAFGTCADCERPVPVNIRGACELCGSESVIRAYSLATRIWDLRFKPGRGKFLRRVRVA